MTSQVFLDAAMIGVVETVFTAACASLQIQNQALSKALVTADHHSTHSVPQVRCFSVDTSILPIAANS